jgi:hypothetical protein
MNFALLAPATLAAVLGNWSGNCHITQDDLLGLPPEFAMNASLSTTPDAVVFHRTVQPSAAITPAFALKVQEAFTDFIFGPEQAPTGDFQVIDFSFQLDAQSSILTGYTENQAKTQASNLQITNESVVGSDFVAIYDTTAVLSPAPQGLLLTVDTSAQADLSSSTLSLKMTCDWQHP